MVYGELLTVFPARIVPGRGKGVVLLDDSGIARSNNPGSIRALAGGTYVDIACGGQALVTKDFQCRTIVHRDDVRLHVRAEHHVHAGPVDREVSRKVQLAVIIGDDLRVVCFICRPSAESRIVGEGVIAFGHSDSHLTGISKCDRVVPIAHPLDHIVVAECTP